MGNTKNQQLPLVAICGRPNVGKSTLFNRIIGKYRAIVHDQEGITRDRFFGETERDGHRFRLVDTGGIIENPQDAVSQKMQEQVKAALDEAAVIVFVVDGQQPLTRTDHEMRETLFRYGKPVVLAVNKLDNPQMSENSYDFYSLGMGEPYPISSGHGLGVEDMCDAIVSYLPSVEELEEAPEVEEGPHPTRVAIIGKPNVGKSSFINALLNEERTIVDDVPGTTRDAIDIPFVWNDKEYTLIDTAGLRRKGGIRKQVEHFSVSRTLRSIRRADIALVMIDATEGMSEQDKRILGYTVENGTALILVYTKWDLVEDKEKRFKAIAEEIDLKMAHIKFAPYITVSNLTRQRLFSVFTYIDQVAEEAGKRIGTGELNQFMEEVRTKHKPPTMKGKAAKILYATQASVKPTTFVLFVNQKKLFHFSYVRYIENQLREQYGFGGVPIKVELREGKPKR